MYRTRSEPFDGLLSRFWQIAYTLSDNQADQEDLVQEMCFIFLENQKRLEGQTKSYVLLFCKRRAQDRLRLGKSLDSKKRDNLTRISLNNTGSISKDVGEPLGCVILDPSPSIEAQITAKEAVERIENDLSREPKLVETFKLLKEEFTRSEIASQLKVNPSTITRRVEQIKEIALKYV